MTKEIFASIIFITSLSGANAQERFTPEQKSIQKVVIDLFQALSDRDISKLKESCTLDVMFLENGILWNIDSLAEKINQNRTITDFQRINTIDFISTKNSGNVAWASYDNQAEITKNGKHGFVTWLETVVLIKEGTFWKVSVLHSTRKG